jgi:SpoVK/Ycf46/Vps4 family AAA+-type ATPase
MNDFDDITNHRRKRMKMIHFDREFHRFVELDKPDIRFADVGGLEDVKKRIRLNFILPLKQPEVLAAYGKSAGGSLLLYGPPGCGKTFLAKAVAGEIEGNFMHVELQAILSMYIGESEQHLHDFFVQAQEYKPCVLFFDELDALGGSRGRMDSHHDRSLVNQLLLELDGLDSKKDGVFIIGATNTPWYLDSALRRPGRFNHLVFVPPPDEAERLNILELKLAGKPTENLDLAMIAEMTKLFSGADLEMVVQDAVDKAMERTFETGDIHPITQKDLLSALKERKPSTLEWFATAKNYAVFSDENRDYQVVIDYMKRHGIR